MPYETVLFQRRNRTGLITLNRPEVKNAINSRLADELSDICSRVSQDESIRVVTITGAGDTFSVAADWCGYSSGTHMTSETLLREYAVHRVWSVATAVAKLDCPVIAAINGDALGQGLELALACDLRIAVETAHLGLTQIASGLIPCDGGTQRLPRLVGRTKAIEMILLGKPINAKEALRVGLVNKVVKSKELPLAVEGISQRIASHSSLALKYGKEAIRKGMDLALEQGLRLETDLYLLLQTTRDRTEGITAFREKRKPKFRGK